VLEDPGIEDQTMRERKEGMGEPSPDRREEEGVGVFLTGLRAPSCYFMKEEKD